MNFIQTATRNSWVNLDHVAHTEPEDGGLLRLHMVNGESVLVHASDFDLALQRGGIVLPNTVKQARVWAPTMLAPNGHIAQALPVIAWRQTSAHVWMPITPGLENRVIQGTPLALQLDKREDVDTFSDSFSTEYDGYFRSVEEWMTYERDEIKRKEAA